MKKSVFMFLPVALAAIALVSCAGGPPAWDASQDALRQAYPESRFIAERGFGSTRAAAEADASAAVARFISSEVSSSVSVLEQGWQQGGETGGRTEVESETFVRSQMRLFGIRHADAYFDRAGRRWVTVAYINRDEAWQVYGADFRQQSQALTRLLEAAKGESDPLRKALRFGAAADFARSPEFRGAESLGTLLNPAKMEAEFAQVRSMLAGLPQKADDARWNSPVFIDIGTDFESAVRNAFSRKFAALGFPVADSRGGAAAVCLVTVEEGMQERQLGTFYFPKVQAVLSGPAGTLFTFSEEAPRQAAVTPDVAKRLAYRALADMVQEKFSMEVNF